MQRQEQKTVTITGGDSKQVDVLEGHCLYRHITTKNGRLSAVICNHPESGGFTTFETCYDITLDDNECFKNKK